MRLPFCAASDCASPWLILGVILQGARGYPAGSQSDVESKLL